MVNYWACLSLVRFLMCHILHYFSKIFYCTNACQIFLIKLVHIIIKIFNEGQITLNSALKWSTFGVKITEICNGPPPPQKKNSQWIQYWTSVIPQWSPRWVMKTPKSPLRRKFPNFHPVECSRSCLFASIDFSSSTDTRNWLMSAIVCFSL